MPFYRGYAIVQKHWQGTACYWCPVLGGKDLAANLATMKRWIDAAIASGELRRID